MNREVIVIDVGTGYTKAGFAGNFEPTHIFKTQMLQHGEKKRFLGNYLDLEVGVSTTTKIPDYEQTSILNHGQIGNWDDYERYMSAIYYEKLKTNPEENYTILTEPPMTSPENRERLAELMFETFNVPGFYIGVQAVMALYASRISKETNKDLSGVVVDSGDGVTHIIPIIKGYVMSSCIKSMPLAGGDITKFIAKLLRKRKEDIPTDKVNQIAAEIKENYSYNCPSIIKEFDRFDDPNEKHGFIKHDYFVHNKKKTVDVGYEQFLAPELFFNPEFYGSNFTETLPELVDSCIQKSPMVERLNLYDNIILSGGSTMFKGFDKRLQRDLNRIVLEKHNNKRAKARVITHSKQRYAVWFGASILGKVPQFANNIHTKQQYEEVGPRIARYNAVFFG
eukprot:GAHX01000205.1.p1 GENE.GAHX01000205.1~~GAHX01000205.1.p1  ORF type:complete len:394 (-),score=78.50 GAHX01000205.1:34-1215(-)